MRTLSIPDAIRDIGRAEAYEAIGLRICLARPELARAFWRAAGACRSRCSRAVERELGAGRPWSGDVDPAEVRRRAEVIARQMELGAQMAEIAARRWDDTGMWLTLAEEVPA